MFSYRLPEWKKRINTKMLSLFMTGLYVVTVLPMLVLGHFNWPSADDMSLALVTHKYYVETGSFVGTFFKAFEVGLNEYLNWMGYYFSNVVFCYSPSIFGEKWHFLVGYVMIGILTLGVTYFFDALFVKALKGDKHLTNSLSMLVLTVTVQSMEQGMARVEAFYWYSGAINYMFMFGMGMFWLGLMIRCVYDEKKKSRVGKFVFAVFWGFWLGGANYMTALELAICSFLVIVIFVMVKLGKFQLEGVNEDQRKAFGFIWIPALVNFAGFMLSCFAPGNATREAQVQGFGAVKSVFTALYYGYDMCLTDFSRWEVWICFIMMIPICYKLSEKISHRFRHPFVFAVFAFGMVSSNMVPPIFALGNLEAGRLRSIIWAEYVVMMALTVFYFTAWFSQSRLEKDKVLDSFSEGSSLILVTLLLFLLFGSVLCVHVDPHYYSVSSAVYDIATGNAAEYLRENRERLAVLEDDSVSDPVFKPYSANPSMLVFFDITRDKEDWINKAMARYYNKNTVVLED